MKPLLLIPALLMGAAATDSLQDATIAIAKAQAERDALISQIAVQQQMIASQSASDGATLLTMLNASCPGCADYLRATLPTAGKLDGVIILCCGPSTVPETAPGARMLYFYQTPKGKQ